MSVLDDFRDAEKRVKERLKELEPAVNEYRELEQVAQRLGLDIAGGAPAVTRRARRRSPSSSKRAPAGGDASSGASSRSGRSRRSGRSNASPGQRTEQLLALVRERPGVTVREAGRELGVDPTSLYRVVRRLEERGEVRKNGRQLEPAGPAG